MVISMGIEQIMASACNFSLDTLISLGMAITGDIIITGNKFKYCVFNNNAKTCNE